MRKFHGRSRPASNIYISYCTNTFSFIFQTHTHMNYVREFVLTANAYWKRGRSKYLIVFFGGYGDLADGGKS